MPIHQATFINTTPKNGYQPHEQRTILLERTVQGKLKVTSLGVALPMIYDKDEDFYKDWKIDKTTGIEGQ